MSEPTIPMTLRIEWSPDHLSNRIVQIEWPSQDDVGYHPDSHELSLTAEVGEWCSDNLREFPDLVATDWVEIDEKDLPSTIELTFEDENDAILFRVKWLDRLK